MVGFERVIWCERVELRGAFCPPYNPPTFPPKKTPISSSPRKHGGNPRKPPLFPPREYGVFHGVFSLVTLPYYYVHPRKYGVTYPTLPTQALPP